jgi:membrane protease YdiL (CAAX protease family)
MFIDRQKIRPVALKIRSVGLIYLSVSFGFGLCFLVQKIFKIDVPRSVKGVTNVAFGALAAFILFPCVLKIPFGHVSVKEFSKRLGLYPFPAGAWKHVLLGILLAACTVSGMLAGTMLTGKYHVNWQTINLSQFIFSLGPGMWEETFFRGVLMMLLLQWTKSLRTAIGMQIILFGIGHLSGIAPWDIVDSLSVMILTIGFTYTAYKTRSLLAGIVFHFFHDSLLFFPQLPGGNYSGFHDNMVFYLGLWSMVGVGCLIVKLAADTLGVRADEELYSFTRASVNTASESGA